MTDKISISGTHIDPARKLNGWVVVMIDWRMRMTRAQSARGA
ncbi:hypothetical protein [Sphingobium sp.]